MEKLSDSYLYDVECSDYIYDIKLYRELTKKIRGPILEIGAGTGRITFPLLKDGHKIYALDNSSEQLNRLIEKSELEEYLNFKENLTFIHGDATNFKLDIDFSRIILPFNFLHLLDNENKLIDCLNLVKKHLKKSGKGILSIFVPDNIRLGSSQMKIHNFTKNIKDGMNISQYETSIYDSSTQLLNIHYDFFIKKGKKSWIQTRDLKLRLIFPNEMLLLLKYCGLKVEKIYGDFDMRDFNEKSSHMIVVFKK